MKQSIGYTLTLNIAIIFIVIIFAIIAMSLSYYKAYKVSNVITTSIQKYEGYNSLSEQEIINKLTSLGYNMTSVNCSSSRNSCPLVRKGDNGTEHSEGDLGYCVYLCSEQNNYYRYRTTTNMMLNFPIINRISNIPVETITTKMYAYDIGSRYLYSKLSEIYEVKDEVYDYVYVAPVTGEYEIQASGAAGNGCDAGQTCTTIGGTNNTIYTADENTKGGEGATVQATVNLTRGDVLYVVLGGKYTGYNGGGEANYALGYNGGGATHVATKPGTLEELFNKNEDDSIILVAGGGGGAQLYYGSLKGGDACGTGENVCQNGNTYTTGGSCQNNYLNVGKKGKGAKGEGSGGGGGGGYKGGYSGVHCTYTVGSGSGGTSYIKSGITGTIIEKDNVSIGNTGNGKLSIKFKG